MVKKLMPHLKYQQQLLSTYQAFHIFPSLLQDTPVPLWTARAQTRGSTMLSFAITDDGGSVWYQDPVQANIIKKVVGVEDQTFAIHVFYIPSNTAKDIHLNIPIQPPNGEGSDNQA